jgi:hypothetical protein
MSRHQLQRTGGRPAKLLSQQPSALSRGPASANPQTGRLPIAYAPADESFPVARPSSAVAARNHLAGSSVGNRGQTPCGRFPEGVLQKPPASWGALLLSERLVGRLLVRYLEGGGRDEAACVAKETASPARHNMRGANRAAYPSSHIPGSGLARLSQFFETPRDASGFPEAPMGRGAEDIRLAIRRSCAACCCCSCHHSANVAMAITISAMIAMIAILEAATGANLILVRALRLVALRINAKPRRFEKRGR